MLTLIAGLVLSTSPSAANPISMESFVAQQVPGTHHVKVTWGEEERANPPGKITRDGEDLSVSWVEVDEDWQGNTGSGLVPLDAEQFCDCKVEVGSHLYALGEWKVFENYEEQFVPGDTASAWNIPAPVDQGIDCVTTCGDSTEPMPAPSCSTAGTAPLGLLFLLPLLGLRRRE